MSDLPFSIREEALLDLEESFQWYAKESSRVAESFYAEVSRAFEVIREAPERWPLYERDSRKYVLRRYPFNVIYRIVDTGVVVIAIAHHRRRPSYWRSRTKA